MKVVKNRELAFIPATHEDPENPGVLKKVLLTNEDLIKGQVMMVNWAKLPGGASFATHYHEDMDEIFVIVNGMVRMRVEEETTLLEKGDAVLVPMKKTHRMANPGTKDVEYVVFGISRQKGGKTVVTGKKK